MRREVEAVREREVHERRVQPLVAQLAAEVPQVRARRAAQHLGPRVGHHLKGMVYLIFNQEINHCSIQIILQKQK